MSEANGATQEPQIATGQPGPEIAATKPETNEAAPTSQTPQPDKPISRLVSDFVGRLSPTDTAQTATDFLEATRASLAMFSPRPETARVNPPPAAVVPVAPARDQGDQQFTEYYRLQMAALNNYSFNELGRQAWEIRERFRLIFGEDHYKAYLGSSPPLQASPGHEDAFRVSLEADLKVLLKQILDAYAVENWRSAEIRKIKANVTWACTGVIAASLFVLWRSYNPRWHMPGTLAMASLIIIFGQLGSAVSVFRRLQGLAAATSFQADPIFQINSLRAGGYGIIIALLSGPVFSLIISVILNAGFITAPDLTPAFRPDGLLIPVTFVDMARCLTCAFAAGFAERLVPDVIDRLVDRLPAK